MSRHITVIGAGVIGLSVAHEFARHGDQVHVIADVGTPYTVSAVAAALWFPFRSERSPAVDQILRRSLTRFTELAHRRGTGVQMRLGTVVERRSKLDRSWTELASEVREASPAQLPPGATSGVRVRLPFIVIPEYLPWLYSRLAAHSVRFQSRTVVRLEEFVGRTDLVVVAGGIRGGDLLGGDPLVFPIRGQIVRLGNPGLREWITDEDNPEGVTYVFPRVGDVVVGGVAAEHSWDTATHPDIEAAILHRARLLVPSLRDQPVLGRAAGLRPARSSLRIERVPEAPVATIAAYGHGGAGITLSWGTAERVRKLADM